MNEDDDLFLRVVEKANGDLKDILAQIQNRGTITDDFSLIRIDFFGSDKNFLQMQLPDEKDIRALLKQRKFEEVSKILDGWAISELTDDLVFLKCYALDRIGLGIAAKPILKTLLGKNPVHLSSILLLANMARRSGEDSKFKELIEDAKQINPNDPRLVKLISLTLKRK